VGFTYATLYLGNHLAKLSATERPKVNLLERFLFLDPDYFARYTENIRRIMDCPRWYPYDVSQVPTMVVFLCSDPLSFICIFGLLELLPRAVSQWGGIEALYQPRLRGPSKTASLSPTPAAERLHMRSCLEAAVMLHHGGLLREMHTLGVSLDACNHRGETPLHVACSQGLDDMICLLVALGADPNQMTRYPHERGRAAPHFRNCFNGANILTDPILRPFSSLGFRPGNAEGMPSSFGAEKELQYPIHLAISLGKSIASVRALVNHGADPNARTSSGATALELCFEMGDGREEIVGFLLARGADPNAGVSMGRARRCSTSPLPWASSASCRC
jgi:ankyrin repeat protein